eukprot:gene4793-5420_t
MQSSTGASSYPIASLHVGDLNPDVTEATLFEKFSTVGPVLSIRVCRDPVTRRSLGYAYVNFEKPADAERALDTMNFDPIKGRACRIKWSQSQRDPSLRKSGVGSIFIKNLDKSIDNKALQDTFSAFGNILSCEVRQDEFGESRGFGFVDFETREAAEEAIETVNGMILNDKTVHVSRFISKNEHVDALRDQPKKFKNIVVKNIDESIDEIQLREMFKTFGPITNVSVIGDREKSKGCDGEKSRGCGFIEFQDHEAAKMAVNQMNEKEVGNYKITVCRAQIKGEFDGQPKTKFESQKQERINRCQGVNLYIKNLEDSIDDEKLRAEFTQFGTITSAKVMRNANGFSKGFGFVCFSSPEEATKAVSNMNGRIIISKPWYVALAQKREQRRAQLATQYMHHVYRVPGGAAQSQSQVYLQAGGFYMSPAFPEAIKNQRNAFAVHQPQMVQSIRPRWQAQSQIGFSGGYVQPYQRHPRSTHPAGVAGGVSQQIIAGRGVIQPPRAPAYKLPQVAYNQPGQAAVLAQQPFAVAQIQGTISNQTPLSGSILTQASANDQKLMIGQRLFPWVQQIEPHQAGTITDMLLEIDNSELLQMLESTELLRTKVNEVIQVLNARKAKQFQWKQTPS